MVQHWIDYKFAILLISKISLPNPMMIFNQEANVLIKRFIKFLANGILYPF